MPMPWRTSASLMYAVQLWRASTWYRRCSLFICEHAIQLMLTIVCDNTCDMTFSLTDQWHIF
jgi:hypothetical protein